MSLVARHLEANGIPTLCLGSALDILEAGRPPRAVFVDYPLGHSAGKPLDPADQLDVVRAALQAFGSLRPGDAVRRLPNHWHAGDAWREEAGATRGSATRQPRDLSPQFQWPADRDAAIAAGAL